ncbi:MAG TPA: PKD domain-containing protein [Solirubrobacteraceae bacterium]|nr:PKD domain-containing protein [Solirubrobacteraceae bacterium]
MGSTTFRGLRAFAATATALAAAFALPAAAGAVTQTHADPDDPYETETYAQSTDFRAVTLDTTTQPGTLLVTLELGFTPEKRFGGELYFDTDLDGRADRAVDMDQTYSTHPAVDGTAGEVRYRLRTVTQSTQDCQVHMDGWDGINWYDDVAATTLRMLPTTGTIMTLALPIADLGDPAALRWAAIGLSQDYAIWRHDLVPDEANGSEADPYQPPMGERDDFFCYPDGTVAPGYKVRMTQGKLLELRASPPQPTIQQSPAQARPGDTVTFTAGTADNRALTKVEWDLDRDGQYDDATGTTASKRFDTAGRRFVGVKVTDTAGRTGTAERTVDLQDRPPAATVAQSPDRARPNTPVTLTATATDDGTITAYDWDLDADGAFDDGSGASVTTTFPSERTYAVKVRVRDDGDHETVAGRDVEVAERAPTLSVTTSTATPGTKEKFTVTATVDDDGPIADSAIQWGFDANGDDRFDPYDKATGKSWTLSFGWPGRYVMKARVTDASGKTATARVAVDVQNSPPTFREIRVRAKKIPDDLSGKDPLVKNKPIILETLLYDDNSTRPRVDWDLDGDGGYDDATGEKIEQTYITGGMKTARVRIEDQMGAVALGELAFEVRESETAECAGKVESGLMRVQGCWKKEKDGTSTTKEPVKMNGLTVTPTGNTTLKYQPVGGLLLAHGAGTVRISAGTVVLFEGQFGMDPNCNPKAQKCLAGKWSVPPLANLKGLPLKGEAEVWFTPEGTIVKVNVDVLGRIGFGFTAAANLIVLDEGGLQLNDLEIRSPMVPIKDLSIGQFWIKYEGANKRWAGGGAITLPTPSFTKLSGDFAVSEKYGFERAHGEVDGLNVPLDAFGTAFLQRIAFTLEIKGMDGQGQPRVRMGGGIGISAGPQIAGVNAAAVDGDFLLTFGNPFGIDMEGRISVAGFDVMGGWVSARTNGSVDASGFIGFGLPFPSAFKGIRKDATKVKVGRVTSSGADVYNPLFQIVTLKGEVSAWVEPQAFNLQGGIYAKVLGITLAEAEGLISSKGVAGCGEIIGIRGGFGHTWSNNHTETFGRSCDIGGYEPERLFAPQDSNGTGRLPIARAAQAGLQDGDKAFDVEAGQRALVMKLGGQGGDPLVTLVSPDGTQYAVPGGDGSVQTADFYATKHTLEDLTLLGVRAPKAGRWILRTQPGSVPVTSVETAAILPKPEVKATVRGTGLTRTIDYTVKPIPGQKVEFVEDGSDTHRTVGAATGERGSFTFTPQNGRGQRRKLVAIVTQDGLVRDHVPLGEFTAPPLQRPATPRKLRAVRGKNGRLTVAWNRVAGADVYRVIAKLSDGSSKMVQPTKPGTVLTGVGRDDIVRLNVWAMRNGAETSLRSTLRLDRHQARAPRRALAPKRRKGAAKPRFTG